MVLAEVADRRGENLGILFLSQHAFGQLVTLGPVESADISDDLLSYARIRLFRRLGERFEGIIRVDLAQGRRGLLLRRPQERQSGHMEKHGRLRELHLDRQHPLGLV